MDGGVWGELGGGRVGGGGGGWGGWGWGGGGWGGKIRRRWGVREIIIIRWVDVLCV